MVVNFQTAIFDMDGVITRTANLHAAAWKALFDEFLQRHATEGQPLRPFDANEEYRAYVDGRPRREGIRSFLAERGITASEQEVEALAQRKNALFEERLSQQGVAVFASTLDLIKSLRAAGAKTAVVSSSRHGREILCRGTPVTMYGGLGDDVYVIRRPGEKVVEHENEGIDTVETYVPFTLPDHVENLLAVSANLEGGNTLTGNSLDNHIVGAPFDYERIFGLEGNDTLDGGGRHGGYLDGGLGNDRLIVSFGELLGGPGADTFVAGGRGAHTSPDVAIHILDFTPHEGDRIEIAHVRSDLTAAELFAQGYLRFGSAQNTLTLYQDPTIPQSVQQVFILRGVTSFDPAWITLTGSATL